MIQETIGTGLLGKSKSMLAADSGVFSKLQINTLVSKPQLLTENHHYSVVIS